MSTPLVFDDNIRAELRNLAEFAAVQSVDVATLAERLKVPEKKAAHLAQMTRQTITIPVAFMVTFSIETGHPCGTCRHMSMSAQREGRLPHPTALWMIAQELGFWGGLTQCSIWNEKLQGHGQAVNIVQPLVKP